jgi:hypothetical protein
MTSVPGSSLNALAVDLAAALDRYEQDVEDLVRVWPDPEHYRRVIDAMEQVRLAAAPLPRLSIRAVELLISHAELVQGLWDSTDPRLQAEESVWPVVEQHRACVFRLREACLTIMAATHCSGQGWTP